MPPSAESLFLRPAQPGPRAPAAQDAPRKDGHATRDGRDSFADHVSLREAGSERPQPPDTESGKPAAEGDTEPRPDPTVASDVPDGGDMKMPRLSGETSTPVPPEAKTQPAPEPAELRVPTQAPDTATPDAATPETATPEVAPVDVTVVAHRTRARTAPDDPPGRLAARQALPTAPAIPLLPSRPGQPVVTGEMPAEPVTPIDLEPDRLTGPAPTASEAVRAAPAVEAFRSAAATPSPQVATGVDTTAPAAEPGLHLASGRAAEWRLEAISGNVPAGQGFEARATLTAQPQAVAGQITVAISRSRERSVEIRLDPPELGRVQIRLDPGEDGLRAVILAERPETQDFLRRNAETLLRDLKEAGYENVMLGFDTGGGAQEDAGTREDRAAVSASSRPAERAEAGVPSPSPAGSLVRDSGLDIRL